MQSIFNFSVAKRKFQLSPPAAEHFGTFFLQGGQNGQHGQGGQICQGRQSGQCRLWEKVDKKGKVDKIFLNSDPYSWNGLHVSENIEHYFLRNVITFDGKKVFSWK